MTSPLLDLPGAVAGNGVDAPVAAHYGSFNTEQRALEAGEGFVDLKRTLALWNAFEGPKALIARNSWVDPPSVGIPNLYTISGIMLSDALERTGRTADAQQVLKTAEGVARATRTASDFGFDRAAQPNVNPGENVLQNLVPTAPGAPAAPADSSAITGTKKVAPPR